MYYIFPGSVMMVLYLDGPYGGQHHYNLTWGRRQNYMEGAWETCTKEKQNIIFCL